MIISSVKTTETGYVVNGKHHVTAAPDNTDYQAVQAWIADGNTPEPEFTPAEALKKARDDKLAELKREGLQRIRAVMPGVVDWDSLELELERWLSIDPASRNPTATYQRVLDIYQTGRDAASALNTLNSVAAIKARDAAGDIAWP